MRIRILLTVLSVAAIVSVMPAPRACGQENASATVKAAPVFRKSHGPVAASSDSVLIAEAEEFDIAEPGWKSLPFGTNYYAATFANSFLSRKGYLGAPEQLEKPALAGIEVQIPKAGKYLALVRYEAAYRFETQFRLVVEQNGKKLLDRKS